jgi:hypothetical protein
MPLASVKALARASRRRRAWVVAILPGATLALMAAMTASLLGRVVNARGISEALSAATASSATAATGRSSTTSAGGRADSARADSVCKAVIQVQPGTGTATGPGFTEVKGRLAWSVSILFAVLAIGATFAAALAVVGIASGRGQGRAAGWLLVLLPIPVYRLLTQNDAWKFNRVLLDCTAYHGTQAAAFVAIIETLAYAALLALAIANGCILYRAVRFQGPIRTKTASAAVRLARRQRQMRLLLYTGAAALVAGTVEVTALYTWAASLTDPKLHWGVEGNEIAQSMGLLTGSFYSILLAAIFLPVFAVLRTQAERLADLANPTNLGAVRSKWLADNSLEASIPKQIISLLAVLAPAIAGGPITKLFEVATR